MTTMSIVVVLAAAAIVPAEIARRKGHGFWSYWAFGVLCWIVAVPMALRLKDTTRVDCPYCREPIKPDALRCPHCRSEFWQATDG